MSLYCMVYTSISNQKMANDDLKQLLNKARMKNQAQQITGMLLYLDPYFIQVLEGEYEVIGETFDRIKKDERHYKVSVIYKKEIQRRRFYNWTMGFNRVEKEEIEKMEGFSDFLQQSTNGSFERFPNKVDALLLMFKHEILF